MTEFQKIVKRLLKAAEKEDKRLRRKYPELSGERAAEIIIAALKETVRCV